MNEDQSDTLEALGRRVNFLERRVERRRRLAKPLAFATLLVMGLGTTVYLYAATLNVPTTFTAGNPIKAADVNANFTGLYNNDVVLATQAPIGTIIASVLTQSQINTQCGLGYWQLADGSAAPTSYSSVTGNGYVPDLRGMFLRGKNNGRSDGGQNPDGDLALGAYQPDQLQGHAHKWYPDSSAGTPTPSVYADTGTAFAGASWANARVCNITPTIGKVGDDPAGTYGSARVGTETRARNVTVNYFVRVK